MVIREDAIIIDLRGSGMKWEDISERLPGSTPLAVDFIIKTILKEEPSGMRNAKPSSPGFMSGIFKSEMWAKITEELAVPWRAAEAMHWQLGEQDMARRAGVTPFELSTAQQDGAGGIQPPLPSLEEPEVSIDSNPGLSQYAAHTLPPKEDIRLPSGDWAPASIQASHPSQDSAQPAQPPANLPVLTSPGKQVLRQTLIHYKDNRHNELPPIQTPSEPGMGKLPELAELTTATRLW
ncbi:hypothetical protein BX600DRAFT_440176 [Xylariales sp. PMI_506]|nr:hypothetical protein BX600DRAFT_440176 [Xylariales sp. PMI_506]